MEKQNIENIEFEKNSQKLEKNKEIKTNLEMKLIGWAGSILIITAYSLNSLDYLDSQNIIYPILNLAGAFFLGLRVWSDKNWSNFFLEIFWAAIAVLSIIKWATEWFK